MEFRARRIDQGGHEATAGRSETLAGGEPDARSFRLDRIGPAYKSTVLKPTGPNTWVGRVTAPSKGWTAFFLELTFPSGGKYPFKESTAIRILPDTLSCAAPNSKTAAAPAAKGGERPRPASR
jgi:PhoPQ-activated pathogenicity-related protein